VPGRGLLGAGGCHLLWRQRQRRRPSRFDDAFLYEELRKDQTERKFPATQLLGEEAWASFAAWIASANKIKY
jgi:hypothetical protein